MWLERVLIRFNFHYSTEIAYTLKYSSKNTKIAIYDRLVLININKFSSNLLFNPYIDHFNLLYFILIFQFQGLFYSSILFYAMRFFFSQKLFAYQPSIYKILIDLFPFMIYYDLFYNFNLKLRLNNNKLVFSSPRFRLFWPNIVFYLVFNYI